MFFDGDNLDANISPPPLISTVENVSRTNQWNRPVVLRRLAYIMLVRAILFTLIIGGTVGVHFAWGTPEELGGPYVTFLFVFIASFYVINILYALLHRFVRNASTLALLQISTDLIISAILVHFTGGADSAYTLLFLLSPIASAVTLHRRRAAVLTAVAGTVVFGFVIFFGYKHMLPVLPGQMNLPWQVKPGSLAQSFLTTSAAMFGVAILSGYLASQLRLISEKMQVQQVFIDDLAALNADIIRCLTSGLITVDERGSILTINQAALDILSINERSVMGKNLAAISPELARTVAQQDKISRAEVIHYRGTESQLLGVSVSRLSDHRNQMRGRIINFQDLTLLRKMEETIQRSEHLASLGRMAAGIAHEIRNPLASISGSLELLHSAQQMNLEDQKLMEIALREIERLNSLITDFLEYARPKTPHLESIDLGQEIHILSGTIATLVSSESRPAIRVLESQENLWVQADRDQLSSVLWNLVRNSLEAGEKEEIAIRLTKKNEQQVSLLVCDHASGISQEQLEHIFEPFFTAKEKGTGLGLATVHRIIHEHGGTIEVKSTEGEGTIVTILFPLVPPPHNHRPKTQFTG